MSKILVIDDEVHIQELLKFNLELEGHIVYCADNGNLAMNIVKEEMPDLILLDWMLPEISGINFLKSIRQDEKLQGIPVIMVTAMNMEDDKVEGLENGADDFITKPFSIKEVKARVKSVLRRYNISETKNNGEIISLGDISMDLEKREVLSKGKTIELTLKEFDLLKFFLLNKGRVISREEILEKVWGFDFIGESRTVDVHIRYLRKKLGEEDDKKIIETIRGLGYKFR